MAEKLFRGIRGIRVNTSKKISFYTQTQRQAGRVLFILWLLASSSPARTLAGFVDEDEKVTQGSRSSSPLAVDPSNLESSSSTAASIESEKSIRRKVVPDNEELVAALNAAPSKKQCDWITAAVGWFDNKTIVQLPSAAIRDYAALACVQVTEKNTELLKRYFDSLCNKVKDGSFGEELLIQALAYVLAHLDPVIFAGNPQPLLDLGKNLLEKLNPSQREFKQADYPSARATLEALSQTLFLVHKVAPGHLNVRDGGCYQNFKSKLQEIIHNAQYYPVIHQVRLIKQNLRVLQDPEPDQEGNMRRIAQGLLGVANLVTVGQGLATGELKPAELQAGIQLLKAALQRQRIPPAPWYDQLLDLEGKMLQCLQKRNSTAYPDIEALDRMVGKINSSSLGIKSLIYNKAAQYRQALRFGIAMQLQILALKGPTPEFRKNSISKLIALSEQLSDTEVMQGVLDSLGIVATQSQKERAEEAAMAREGLENLAKRRGSKALQEDPSKAFSAWLSGEKLPAKLERLSKQIPEQSPSDKERLFSQVQKDLSPDIITELFGPYISPEDGKLADHYSSTSFTCVKSLFEGPKSRNVGDLQCQLMLLEQKPVKQDQAAAGSEDHVAKHHERRFEWGKTPIALEDLFKKRSTKPGGTPKKIQRVLLTGDPGTGKTTLSRQLAYLWSVGKWGQEFHTLYLLPVRSVQKSEYDGTRYNREKTLSTAIVNTCFSHDLPATKDKYMSLRADIHQKLRQPTTLVILDGLDEREGASEQILSQAQAGAHKLLMLSRPYGIEAERQLAEIEIEHAGFNLKQLQAYVKAEVSDSEQASALLSYIYKYDNIRSIAHVPVNLQILCALWQENSPNVRKAARQGSLPTLYRLITEFIFKRYKERAEKGSVLRKSQLFKQLGQIALRALEEGTVWITLGLLNRTLTLDDSEGADGVLKICQNAGLLKCVGNCYEFPHLTFQEYFAGLELAQMRWSGDDTEQRKAMQFLSAHKYEPRYARTLSFMVGEAIKIEGGESIKNFLKFLEDSTKEIMGLQHLLLQLRVLHEWLCVASEWQVEGSMAELKKQIDIMAFLGEWFVRAFMHVRLEGYTEGFPGYNLLGLLKSSLQTFGSIPKHVPWLLELFDKATQEHQEPNASVRHAAVDALGEIMLDNFPEVRDRLKELAFGFSDTYAVKQAAWVAWDNWQKSKNIGQDAGEDKLATDDWTDDDECDEQRFYGAVPEAATQSPKELLEQLHQAAKDAKLTAYGAILRPFPKSLVQAVTTATSEEKLSALLTQLRQAPKDAQFIAYDNILKPFKKSLVQAVTKKFNALLELLQQAPKDAQFIAYDNILKPFKKSLVQAVTTEFNALLGLLQQAATKAHFFAYDAILNRFKNSLVQAVTTATQKEFNALHELLSQFAENAKLVAYDAILNRFQKSLVQAVTTATKEEFSALLELLLQATQDPDGRIRVIASEALWKAPLKELLEHYWSTQDTRLIPYITPRLYHTSLVVDHRMRSGNSSQVTLYAGAGQPSTWEQPKSVVADFIGHVQHEVKQLQVLDQMEARLPAPVDASVWNLYFGKVGKEPVLPDDLEATLDLQCPFWNGRQIRDTHMLVLIPSHVAGQLLTLDYLGKLIKQQCQGVGSKKNNLNYWESVRAAIGNKNIIKTKDPNTSYWVLMTRWPIPGTKWKKSEDQRELVGKASLTGLPYEVPSALEALIMAYIQAARSSNNDVDPVPNEKGNGTPVSLKLPSPINPLRKEFPLTNSPSAPPPFTKPLATYPPLLAGSLSTGSLPTKPSRPNPLPTGTPHTDLPLTRIESSLRLPPQSLCSFGSLPTPPPSTGCHTRTESLPTSPPSTGYHPRTESPLPSPPSTSRPRTDSLPTSPPSTSRPRTDSLPTSPPSTHRSSVCVASTTPNYPHASPLRRPDQVQVHDAALKTSPPVFPLVTYSGPTESLVPYPSPTESLLRNPVLGSIHYQSPLYGTRTPSSVSPLVRQ